MLHRLPVEQKSTVIRSLGAGVVDAVDGDDSDGGPRGRRHRPGAYGIRYERRVPRTAGYPPGRGEEEREPDPQDLRGHRDRKKQGRRAPSRRQESGPRERPHEELLRPEGVGNDRAAAAAANRGGLHRAGPLLACWTSCRSSKRRRARRPKEPRRPTPRSLAEFEEENLHLKGAGVLLELLAEEERRGGFPGTARGDPEDHPQPGFAEGAPPPEEPALHPDGGSPERPGTAGSPRSNA